MALGPDRIESGRQEITYFCDTIAERGKIVCYKTSGSGPALDDKNAVVSVYANPSGQTPAGILLSDVIADDPNLYQMGRLKDQEKLGSKVAFDRGGLGWYVTNMLEGTGVVGGAGKPAYLGASGTITDVAAGTVQNPRVGTFLSTKRSDGFVKVKINL